MRVVAVVLKENVDPKSFAEICGRYSPDIALGTHWFFLNIEGCQKLYSEHTLLLRLQSHAKKRRQVIRIGVAADPATALAFAFFKQREKSHLPLAALIFYFNPYKIEFQDKMLKSLSRLGARTLADVVRIPRGSLLRRFGPGILKALERIEAVENFPWTRMVVVAKVEEIAYMDSSFRIQTVEPLIFLLTPLLDSVLERLKVRGQALLGFHILLFQESSSVVDQNRYEFKFELSSPFHRSKPLIPIIRERMERVLLRNPVQTALHEMRIEVLSTAPLKFSQADFLRMQEDQMQESLQALMLRLSERLGQKKVFFAEFVESYIPEKTWKKAIEFSVGNQAPSIARPLRLLKSPVPLQREGQTLRTASRQWTILDIQGPERIQTEWWLETVERDYFLAQTETGEKLWIFISMQDGCHYLHGLFD